MERMGFCGRRYCGDVGGGCLGGGPPLGRPGALTLALSRRAGEGTVVVGGGAAGLWEPVRVLCSAARRIFGCGAYYAGQCFAWGAGGGRWGVAVSVDGRIRRHILQGLEDQRILMPSRRVERPE